MTSAKKAKKASSQYRTKNIPKLIKNGLAGLGLLTIVVTILISTNSTLSSHAASVITKWAINNDKALPEETFALAPFEFETAGLAGIDEDDGRYRPVRLSAEDIDALPVLDLSEITPEQLKVTKWIANRYRVAPDMVALLVKEAWVVGEQKNVDPTLILGIIAIESRFNPYAQSTVGATGLMQVMTKVHSAKLENTGGALTVFDPVTNLHVGVQILEEHVRRAGSLTGGLKQYVGATGPTDNGYAAKVLAERDRIRKVMFATASPSLEQIIQAGKLTASAK